MTIQDRLRAYDGHTLDVIMTNEAADTIDALVEALESAASWLDRWGQHVPGCQQPAVCTCGLHAMRHETAAALDRVNGDAP